MATACVLTMLHERHYSDYVVLALLACTHVYTRTRTKSIVNNTEYQVYCYTARTRASGSQSVRLCGRILHSAYTNFRQSAT
jgi:hypothetical protein